MQNCAPMPANNLLNTPSPAAHKLEALRQQGVPVSYQTKINGAQLSQLMAEINPTLPQNKT